MSNSSNLPLAGTPEQQLADPLHLFPNADNAGQPSMTVPGQLPTLGGGMTGSSFPGINSPRIYGGMNVSRAQPLAPGAFNQQVANLVGKLYTPTMMQPQAPGGYGGGRGGFGGGLGGMSFPGGGMPAFAAMMRNNNAGKVRR